MSSAKNKYFFEINVLLVAFMFACGLWYIVVGNAHVESNIAVRVEYRSLPTKFVTAEDTTNTINVRVRASGELLQNLTNRDLYYSINLSKIERGANVIPIEIGTMVDFKGVDIINVDPTYVVVEVDTIATKTIPIKINFTGMENKDLEIRNIAISPAVVNIKGPTAMLRDLEYLPMVFDLNKMKKIGSHSRPLQLVVPGHLSVDTPVATLSFDVVAKKTPAKID